MSFGLQDRLAVELEDDSEHPVRRGVLRSQVKLQLLDVEQRASPPRAKRPRAALVLAALGLALRGEDAPPPARPAEMPWERHAEHVRPAHLPVGVVLGRAAALRPLLGVDGGAGVDPLEREVLAGADSR